jgi:hypothetical protein
MSAAVTLYWLPLGAGGHFVRHNGRMFEAVVARREHREPRELYHAALEVELEGDRFTIEMDRRGTSVPRTAESFRPALLVFPGSVTRCCFGMRSAAGAKASYPTWQKRSPPNA